VRLRYWVSGAALALTSALALAQGAPESLLPPGFGDTPPAPAPATKASPRPAASPAATPSARPSATPVVQPLPSSTAAAPLIELPAFAGDDTIKRLPSLDELARMTPEDFQALLGLKADFDTPPGARRAMSGLGLIDEGEGGLPQASLARQNARLVRLALAANRGDVVSRWGHILLRRALASRLDPPPGMSPQEFLALRAGLLLRMGEADAARAVLQDIDLVNFTPELDAVALDTYVNTADFTGVCPVMTTRGTFRDDAAWDTAKAICSAFRGNGAAAVSQLDRFRYRGTMPRIDLLLATRYASAAGRSRRAVTIEWEEVKELTPWRLGLANALGLNPPEMLMKDAPARYSYMTTLAPAVGLARRAAAADRSAAAGILSSAAMVDLYGQLYADPDVTGEWSDRAEKLRDAYVLETPAARLDAMRSLWNEPKAAWQAYSRQVLTAYAAARIPPSADLADSAAPLIASMLAAGLDANAMRWANVVPAGSEAWALLALAAPTRQVADGGGLDTFVGDDETEGSRKAALLVAGLAGLERIDSGTANRYSGDLNLDLTIQTRWTRTIDAAARRGDVATVVLLAGLGMQGTSWKQMSARYLYHTVAALRAVGLEAEARMIAAEAVARA